MAGINPPGPRGLSLVGQGPSLAAQDLSLAAQDLSLAAQAQWPKGQAA